MDAAKVPQPLTNPIVVSNLRRHVRISIWHSAGLLGRQHLILNSNSADKLLCFATHTACLFESAWSSSMGARSTHYSHKHACHKTCQKLRGRQKSDRKMGNQASSAGRNADIASWMASQRNQVKLAAHVRCRLCYAACCAGSALLHRGQPIHGRSVHYVPSCI